MGILFTLVIVVILGRYFIVAIQEERPVKAILLAMVIAFVLVLCANGGYVNLNRGVDVTRCAPQTAGSEC